MEFVKRDANRAKSLTPESIEDLNKLSWVIVLPVVEPQIVYPKTVLRAWIPSETLIRSFLMVSSYNLIPRITSLGFAKFGSDSLTWGRLKCFGIHYELPGIAWVRRGNITLVIVRLHTVIYKCDVCLPTSNGFWGVSIAINH